MAPPLRADSQTNRNSSWQVHPRFENLERRDLLSLTQPVDASNADAGQFFAVQTDDPALFDREGWMDLFGDSDGPGTSGGTGSEPLPIIPLDDSFDPYLDCPGLDDEFCLPAGGEMDFGFEDFLRLQSNFGQEGVSRADGDLDGDGRITFGDFLILSESYS